jgi:hypothetical protein
MASQSHTSDGGRERYERIAAAASELAQLLMTLHTLATLNRADMSGLVVENLTTLVLDDAAEFASRDLRSWRLSSSSLATPDSVTRWPRSSQERVLELLRIDAEAANTSRHLADAISTARQACKALAEAGGSLDLRLLQEVAAALRRVSSCYHTLGQFAHDRTLALSSLRDTLTMPLRQTPADIETPTRVTPIDGTRRVRSARQMTDDRLRGTGRQGGSRSTGRDLS